MLCLTGKIAEDEAFVFEEPARGQTPSTELEDRASLNLLKCTQKAAKQTKMGTSAAGESHGSTCDFDKVHVARIQ